MRVWFVMQRHQAMAMEYFSGDITRIIYFLQGNCYFIDRRMSPTYSFPVAVGKMYMTDVAGIFMNNSRYRSLFDIHMEKICQQFYVGCFRESRNAAASSKTVEQVGLITVQWLIY